MRTKHRSAFPPPPGLFDPPPQTPRPDAQAIEEARRLLQQLLIRLVVSPGGDTPPESPPSCPQHQRQHGRSQTAQRQPDGPERDAFDQTEPCLD